MMELILNSTLRMIGDKVLLLPMPWDASKTIVAIRHGNHVRGKIVAIGPGANPKKYKDSHRGRKTIMEYSRHFRPTELKVGDVVELGGLNIFDGKGYQFTEISLDGITHLLCSENDVAIVREDLCTTP